MNVNYDDLGDVLEYGAISDNEAIEMCDNILKESLTKTDDIVLESMFHAVYMGVSHRDIASKIDIDLFWKNWNALVKRLLFRVPEKSSSSDN